MEDLENLYLVIKFVVSIINIWRVSVQKKIGKYLGDTVVDVVIDTNFTIYIK